MSVTVQSSPNIAFIKYWGNRNNALRLPAYDSCSMTLSHPVLTVTIDHEEEFSLKGFTADGTMQKLNESDTARFERYIELTKEYLGTLGAGDALPKTLSIITHSAIPPRIGLASSAAVFSGLARAIAELVKEEIVLTDTQVSVIARFGAGSATRSIFDGFASFIAGEGDAIDSAYGEVIAGADHWNLQDIVIVPSEQPKKVGSTEGHALAHTSPHFAERTQAITERRQKECVDAILTRDFEKLQHISEEDCLDMFRVMESSTPSLHYLTENTHRIIGAVKDLREAKHLPVLYTMDAGPTVHCICTDEAREHVAAFAKDQEGCRVFETSIGRGAHILPSSPIHGSTNTPKGAELAAAHR